MIAWRRAAHKSSASHVRLPLSYSRAADAAQVLPVAHVGLLVGRAAALCLSKHQEHRRDRRRPLAEAAQGVGTPRVGTRWLRKAKALTLARTLPQMQH